MRILLTNDDGIDAPGLIILEKIANKLAGDDGEVWVVAPLNERSGVAHCISYITPARIEERGERRFAVDGYPADCVLGGVHQLMGNTRPDLVLSGVNRGNNSGENTLYSGTIGAAMEGALQGIPSFALSQYYGTGNNSLDNPFEAAEEHGLDVLRAILGANPTNNGDEYGLFYNINFPPVAAAKVKGTKVVPQGRRDNVKFEAHRVESPSRRPFLWMRGGVQTSPSKPGTDVHENLNGHISVTPMRCDMTARDVVGPLAEALNGK